MNREGGEMRDERSKDEGGRMKAEKTSPFHGREPAQQPFFILHPSSFILALFHPSSFILLLALVAASCGFKLRGDAELPFDTLHISGASQTFAQELKRVIETRSDAQVIPDAGQAQATLQIISEGRERFILALSGGGRVREFELRYRVSYRVLNAEQREIGPVGEIFLRRDFTYNDAQALAKEAEEAELYRDMQSDAVRQIVRRLSAVSLS